MSAVRPLSLWPMSKGARGRAFDAQTVMLARRAAAPFRTAASKS